MTMPVCTYAINVMTWHWWHWWIWWIFCSFSLIVAVVIWFV